jgi:cytochrome c2
MTRKILLIGCALATIAGVSFIIGFAVSDQVIVPSATLLKVKMSIRNYLRPPDDLANDGKRIIWSTFLPFEVNEFDVPVKRKGAGGGLTSIGDTLVVLTHEGRLFGFNNKSVVRPLKIDTPDNGYDDYVMASQGKFAHLTHTPHYFRYNDVLFYESNKRAALVISYTEWSDERECYGTAIAILDLPLEQLDVFSVYASATDWRVIFRTQPCLPLKETSRALEGHMAGGRIAFKPPNKIVLGSGDYHWDGMYAPLAFAQDTSNDYGKVIEIDLASGEARHLSIGNRNVQGITVDKDGEIWAVEHGPRGGDELNKISDGANLGWPLATLGTRYNKLPVPSAYTIGSHDHFDAPVYAWLPSIGVSNITQLRNFDASWDNDLLVGSLAAQSLFRLRVDGDRVMFAEKISVGHRIRYVHQHESRLLALWTDANKLIVLRKTGQSTASVAINDLIGKMQLDSKRLNALRAGLNRCMECHSFEQGNDVKAPNLAGLHGRRIAATGFRGYSRSLRSLRGKWNDEALKQYLEDPPAFADDTTMPYQALSKEVISDLTLLFRDMGRAE